MNKGWILGLGLLVLGASGCNSMFGSRKKMALYQSEIDRVSAENAVMDRELRDERVRRERAEAIVLADRQDKLEEIQKSSADAKPAPGAAKAATVKPQSVKEIQKALSNAGYDPGPVDGKMGQKTKDAIVAFQKESGLKADGRVGSKTWNELGRYLTASK